jgi:hypothetical protein
MFSGALRQGKVVEPYTELLRFIVFRTAAAARLRFIFKPQLYFRYMQGFAKFTFWTQHFHKRKKKCKKTF